MAVDLNRLLTRAARALPRGTILLIALSLLNLVTALLRETTLAYFFGTSATLDTLLVALTIPRQGSLLAKHLTVTILVPLYIAHREQGNPLAASELVRRWFWKLATASAAVCVVIAVFAEPLVGLLAPGLAEETTRQAGYWLRWLLPFLWILAVAPCFKVVLDSHRRFAGPAAAGSIVSVCVIAACAIGAGRFGIGAVIPGFIVGAALVFLVQWLAARPVEPGLLRLGRLTDDVKLPIAGAGIMTLTFVATQFHMLVDRAFASTLVEGSISALNFAKSINAIPTTVVAAAVTTALFPVLATYTARSQWGRAMQTARRWMVVMCVAGLVPVGLLIVFRVQVVTLLFQRGEFDAAAVDMTAGVLTVLPFGIVITSVSMLVDRVLLAQRRIGALAGLSVFSIALKVAFNYLFVVVLPWDLMGLATATVLATGVGTVARYMVARRPPAEQTSGTGSHERQGR